MADYQHLKYCIVAKILQNLSRFSKTLVTRYRLPDKNISGELKSCNSFRMHPPLRTSLLVATDSITQGRGHVAIKLLRLLNVASPDLSVIRRNQLEMLHPGVMSNSRSSYYSERSWSSTVLLITIGKISQKLCEYLFTVQQGLQIFW